MVTIHRIDWSFYGGFEMTYQQREEYTAPVCEVLTFEVEETITQQSAPANPTFHTGSDASQDDDETF